MTKNSKIAAICPACKSRFAVAAQHAGKKIRCPKCKGVLTVPTTPPVQQTKKTATSAAATASSHASLQVNTPNENASDSMIQAARDEQLERFRAAHAHDKNIPVWVWFLLVGSLLFGSMGYAAWKSQQQHRMANAPSGVQTRKNDKRGKALLGKDGKPLAEKDANQKLLPQDEVFQPGKVKTKLLPPKPDNSPSTPDRIAAKLQPSMVLVLAQNKEGATISRGSGFFVGKPWLVVTTYFNTREAVQGEVELDSGERLKIKGYRAVRKDLDLVLLELEPGLSEFPKIPKQLISIAPQAESDVMAMSYDTNRRIKPLLGKVIRSLPTSKLDQAKQDFVRKLGGFTPQFWIETNIKLQPGSSGGPLVDYDGRIVGMLSWGDEGHSYALHIRHLVEVMNEIYPEAVPLSEEQSKRERPDLFKKEN